MEQLNNTTLVTEEEINNINQPSEAVSNERNANQNIPKRRNLL